MSVEFIKFSDERSRKYCIETRIEHNGAERKVIKSAIFPEGKQHLNNILNYGEILKNAYQNVEICPAELKNDELYFEFIEGKLMSELYLEAAESNDRDKYAQLLEYHKEIIMGSENNQTVFEKSEKSKVWFGNLEGFEGKPGLKISNFDATAGNIIIKEQKPVFIDYEWVFDCVLPTDLVVYHCIRDIYLHHEHLEHFFPLKEAIAFLGISCRTQQLEDAYKKFFNHVIEDEDGRSFALMKRMCLKDTQEEPFHAYDELREARFEIDNLKHEVEQLRKELQKTSQYWKQSDEASRFWEMHCNHLNSIFQEYGTIENVKKIIMEKDAHIADYQAQIQHMKRIYDPITQNIFARGLKKVKRKLRK